MKNKIIEQLAEELHRNYRAAEKAMNRVKLIYRKGEKIPNPNLLLHDHGWKSCGQTKYFIKRALLITRRAMIEPTTLDEAEQRYNAEVLRRRLRMGIKNR